MQPELIFLLVAAVLEAGGDALMRLGLHSQAPLARGLWLLAGCLVLGGYGLVVNASGWDFGRLLGAYVAVFFVVSQVINAVVFGRLPGMALLCGGALIVAGGMVIALWGQEGARF
jgi:small multidrug resistance family-3 protein